MRVNEPRRTSYEAPRLRYCRISYPCAIGPGPNDDMRNASSLRQYLPPVGTGALCQIVSHNARAAPCSICLLAQQSNRIVNPTRFSESGRYVRVGLHVAANWTVIAVFKSRGIIRIERRERSRIDALRYLSLDGASWLPPRGPQRGSKRCLRIGPMPRLWRARHHSLLRRDLRAASSRGA